MKALHEGGVVIVTGAGGGIGRAAAQVFAREGASVVLADVSRTAGEEAAHQVVQSGGEAIFVPTDVTKGEEVRRLVSVAIEKYGKLTAAFNNAGIEGPLAPTADYDEAEWDRVIQVNLKGIWNCLRFEIPEMVKAGKGSIVNTASALGQVGAWSMPAYVASKHAVLGLTRTAALDYAPHGVRVNALMPGVVETPMMMSRVFKDNPALMDILKQAHPIGRFAQPDEPAEAAVWLCSDRASFVTGEALACDGGYLAH
ncbi:MAG: glucose 1-dehydrogenase [Paraburkholderia sp.]|uniref:glucose 1-dehydrogenase n=1 Tax=Paraburkholderia sp. TaxID=1926495 RepID=UPI0011FE0D06|nr:glucose 1-dehydrogenase [Paraburkholderia sp.]TAL98728.1 MAG: glucose 1-dehydrogenase [Paraburkholderia sp.]